MIFSVPSLVPKKMASDCGGRSSWKWTKAQASQPAQHFARRAKNGHLHCSTRLPGFHSFLVVVECPLRLVGFSVRYSRQVLLLIGSRKPWPIRVCGTAVARAGEGVCLVDLPYSFVADGRCFKIRNITNCDPVIGTKRTTWQKISGCIRY